MSGKAHSEVIALLGEIADSRMQALKRPVRIGVSGGQGSGKTTLCRAFAASRVRVAHFSMDDVYLPTPERKALADKISPLLKTRGPAGTHDLALAKRVIAQLAGARARDVISLPRYDKLADKPVKPELWPTFQGTPNVILVDGWCLGATAQTPAALQDPVNALEANEDAEGRWRGHVNAQLEGPYAEWFTGFDAILALDAPNWEVIPRWRAEQEAQLRALAPDALPPEVKTNLARFVLFYERITRHMLAGGRRADWAVKLDENRAPIDISEGG